MTLFVIQILRLTLCYADYSISWSWPISFYDLENEIFYWYIILKTTFNPAGRHLIAITSTLYYIMYWYLSHLLYCPVIILMCFYYFHVPFNCFSCPVHCDVVFIAQVIKIHICYINWLWEYIWKKILTLFM